MPATARIVLLVAVAVTGCGSSARSVSGQSHARGKPALARRRPPPTLHFARALAPLPAPRSGIAAAAFGANIVVSGGLSPAGVSTDSVFQIGSGGGGGALPTALHDAAAAQVGGRLLVFGGGQAEGTDQIVAVLPAPPRLLGTLPQPLSDLVAVTIGATAYVFGGWNGSVPNRDIYAVKLGPRPPGTVRVAGSLPLGVRYPAAAALDGRVLVAGGETAAGTPTSQAWSFDPATRRVVRLPDLPSATDHTAGAVLDGRFYVIGGLRDGAFTDAILSWAPGARRWRSAGHLPAPLSDLAAVPFDGGIAVIGGRGSGGQVATVTLMRPA